MLGRILIIASVLNTAQSVEIEKCFECRELLVQYQVCLTRLYLELWLNNKMQVLLNDHQACLTKSGMQSGQIAAFTSVITNGFQAQMETIKTSLEHAVAALDTKIAKLEDENTSLKQGAYSRI